MYRHIGRAYEATMLNSTWRARKRTARACSLLVPVRCLCLCYIRCMWHLRRRLVYQLQVRQVPAYGEPHFQGE